MKRIAAVAALALCLGLPMAWAQHEPAEERAEKAGHDVTEGEEGGGMEVFAWLNFALLTAGLVWIFRKNAVPYFASRAIGIRKGMIEADEARAAAEHRMADVEARLSRLQADIQLLKDEAMKEAQAESIRGREETAAALAKIRVHAEREIESAGKSARFELKRYSAQLALGIAERKIRARLNPATQDALFQGFLHQLDSATGARNT